MRGKTFRWSDKVLLDTPDLKPVTNFVGKIAPELASTYF